MPFIAVIRADALKCQKVLGVGLLLYIVLTILFIFIVIINFIQIIKIDVAMERKSIILINFGKKVRELRKNEGISQEQLAFKTGLHRTYIGMIERAEKNITLINIEKIANAFNINILDLFNER